MHNNPRIGKGLKKARLRALERLRTELIPKLFTFLESIVVGPPDATKYVLPLEVNQVVELPEKGFVQPVRNQSLKVLLARSNIDEDGYMKTRHLLPYHMASVIPAQVQRMAVLDGEVEHYYSATLNLLTLGHEVPAAAAATSVSYYFKHLSLPLKTGLRYKELCGRWGHNDSFSLLQLFVERLHR